MVDIDLSVKFDNLVFKDFPQGLYFSLSCHWPTNIDSFGKKLHQMNDIELATYETSCRDQYAVYKKISDYNKQIISNLRKFLLLHYNYKQKNISKIIGEDRVMTLTLEDRLVDCFKQLCCYNSDEQTNTKRDTVFLALDPVYKALYTGVFSYWSFAQPKPLFHTLKLNKIGFVEAHKILKKDAIYQTNQSIKIGEEIHQKLENLLKSGKKLGVDFTLEDLQTK